MTIEQAKQKINELGPKADELYEKLKATKRHTLRLSALGVRFIPHSLIWRDSLN